MPLPIPQKIGIALDRVLEWPGQSLFVLKTTCKPSAYVPTLWLGVTDRRVFLFSTRKPKSVFKSATYSQINSVRAGEGNRMITIFFVDYSIPDLTFRLADDVPPELALRCVHEIQRRLLEAGRTTS